MLNPARQDLYSQLHHKHAASLNDAHNVLSDHLQQRKNTEILPVKILS